jgi:hypothetical protein
MFTQVAELFHTKEQVDMVRDRLSRIPMTPGMIETMNSQTNAQGVTPLDIFMQQQASIANMASQSIHQKRSSKKKAHHRNTTSASFNR